MKDEGGRRPEFSMIERWRKEESLRNAEVAYITDEQQRPAEYWWQQYCADAMQLTSYLRRVNQGQWRRRRDRYWRSVVNDVLRKTRYRVVADKARELQEIQEIRANTLELIQPRVIDGNKFYKVQPSSYEGLVNALVKLDALGDAKRDSLLGIIDPEVAREGGEEEKQMLFPHDEMETLAAVLLEQRMEKQRRRLTAHKDTDADDQD